MRKDWNTYFMDIAHLISERATCTRLKVGAVIVKDKRIIATGFNGSVTSTEHCIEVGCNIVENHCIRTLHAEHNAVLQCAKFGVPTVGAEIYVTHFPCFQCAKIIAQTGITKVYYASGYNNDTRTFKLFNQLGIKVIKLESR